MFPGFQRGSIGDARVGTLALKTSIGAVSTMSSDGPTRFSRWMMPPNAIDIERKIGTGPYGNCYKGTIEGKDETLVIKYLRQFTKDRERYFEEIACVAELKCPAIVKLVGLCTSNANVSVITESAARGTFAQALSHYEKFSHWPVGFGKVQMSCMQYGIAFAMFMLHGKEIIHGSLKPENILFSKKYEPLLTDFSQASCCPKPKRHRFKGTDVLYIAPEVLMGGKITSKSDVYSFGMLLFACYSPKYPQRMDDGSPIKISIRHDVTVAITRGKRFERPKKITDEYWNLICKCWNKDPDERPDFKEILDTLKGFNLFRGQPRDLLHYTKYITRLEGNVVDNDIPEETLLSSANSYKQAISDLSLHVVSSRSAVSVCQRKLSRVRFKCQYCDVQYRIELNMKDKIWNVFQIGKHIGHEGNKGKPITEHLRNCIAAGIAKGKKGSHLVKFVRKRTGCKKLPTSTVYYYIGERPEKNWLASWRKLPDLGRCFREAGLRFETNFKDGVLNSVVFELPGVKMCQTKAFNGLLFVDGCFMNDRLRSTLLAMATITADHILMPVIAMICPGETKESYELLFQFAKDSLPQKFTIMSDQGTGVINGFDEVFKFCPDIQRIPCMFHVWQPLSHDVRWEIQQLIKCDHKLAYKAMKKVFAHDHKALFSKLHDVLRVMCYRSNHFAGLFEIIADSPIESLNAALRPYRSSEPFEFIQVLFHFCQDQVALQEARLEKAESPYCRSCENTIDHRKEAAKELDVREEKGYFMVSELFVVGTTVDYKVEFFDNSLCCSCEGYQRLGIPCRHMYAAANKSFEAFAALPEVSPVHSVQTIREALNKMKIDVTTGDVKETDIKVRDPRRRPGRPRLRRFRPVREYTAPASNLTCSVCGQKGHTCRALRCPERNKTVAEKGQKKKKTIKDKAAVSLNKRAKSVDVVREGMCLNDTGREKPKKTRIGMKKRISGEKEKVCEALAEGANKVLDVFDGPVKKRKRTRSPGVRRR